MVATFRVAQIQTIFLFGLLQGVAGAAPRDPMFLAENAYLCPAMGHLIDQSSERDRKGCFLAMLRPERVVVLDAPSPFVFACFPVRGGGTAGRVAGRPIPTEQLLCGYALQAAICDRSGKRVTARVLEEAALASSVADVHRVPDVGPVDLNALSSRAPLPMNNVCAP